jgi:organic radical activating enzyme
MVKNLQLAEKIHYSDGQQLDVVHIWTTIQGEGPLTGRRAIFIRLAGCNMQCPGCDTDYTSDRKTLSLDQIIKIVDFLCMPQDTLVVITGGEPLRQNIKPLILGLYRLKLNIQLELSGTAYQDIPHGAVTTVCSPKAAKVHPQLVGHVDYYKYVLQHGDMDVVDGLPMTVLGGDIRPARPPEDFPHHKVFLQPMDEEDSATNHANLLACARSCMTFGYTLGVQLHKIIGLP